MYFQQDIRENDRHQLALPAFDSDMSLALAATPEDLDTPPVPIDYGEYTVGKRCFAYKLFLFNILVWKAVFKNFLLVIIGLNLYNLLYFIGLILLFMFRRFFYF